MTEIDTFGEGGGNDFQAGFALLDLYKSLNSPLISPSGILERAQAMERYLEQIYLDRLELGSQASLLALVLQDALPDEPNRTLVEFEGYMYDIDDDDYEYVEIYGSTPDEQVIAEQLEYGNHFTSIVQEDDRYKMIFRNISKHRDSFVLPLSHIGFQQGMTVKDIELTAAFYSDMYRPEDSTGRNGVELVNDMVIVHISSADRFTFTNANNSNIEPETALLLRVLQSEHQYRKLDEQRELYRYEE